MMEVADLVPIVQPIATVMALLWLLQYWKYAFQRLDQAYWELLPFTWIACAVLVLIDLFVRGPDDMLKGNKVRAVEALIAAMFFTYQAYRWFRIWRDSNDDTWKKRRRRWAERIESLGRLAPE